QPDVDRSVDVSGTAVSLEVDRDDLVALGEYWKNRPEHLARPKPPVQQDQRAPGPVGFVVEVDAVDLGVLAGALHVSRPVGLHGGAPLSSMVTACRISRLRPCLEFIGRRSCVVDGREAMLASACL